MAAGGEAQGFKDFERDWWHRQAPNYDDRAGRMTRRAVGPLLDAVGVPRHPGRDCLVRAITCVWHDRRRVSALKRGLYPEIARQTGLTPAQVERAMRHAIEVAWSRGRIVCAASGSGGHRTTPGS